jgi:phosphoribosyl 1,2-cyclic phosphodiesterase
MEVLRRLKADPATSGIGVIICTARKYKADQDQALELGAFSVLFKPFENAELLRMVDGFLTGGEKRESQSGLLPTGDVYLPQLPVDRWLYRLWGTRGSIPVSGQRFVRHGGNTSCLELALGDASIIVDAGSGIRDLGLKLVRRPPRRIHILITHTHWDHIQGFPFFAPAYVPGFEIVIHGVPGFGMDLKSIFTGQLARDYFPVQLQDMRAKIEFHRMEQQTLELDGARIEWEFTHHPAATVGFKFALGGKTLAWVSDNEFMYGYLGAPRRITRESDEVTAHRRLVDFLTDVDLLIAEAQYTNEEYPSKIGWGHSSLTNACALTRLTRAKSWIVTHHDPLHDDEFLDQKLNLTREVLGSLDCPAPVSHGYDGMTGYL